jgi:peptidoglycan/xylan/chitin deacetylase (PgdA/CDA1 family)
MEIAKRAKMAGGTVARLFANKSLILMYHRVSIPGTDPWALCVTPENFEEQLQVLKDAFTVVSLRDLAEALRHHRVVDRTVAITFDDGYADNLHNAQPLLDAFDLPATIFITTGILTRTREFWWDELEQMLLNDRPLPHKLVLATTAGERIWHVTSEPENQNMKTMRAWEGEPGSRMALFHDIWESMLRLPRDEQDSVLEQLLASSESTLTVRPSHRSLSAGEIKAISQHGLIDIGAHTVSHPLLTAHSENVQRQEIEDSKSQLEGLTGNQISCFAYPFGDHSETSARLTRELGFECACTTVENTVWRFSDPYRMPRLAVENWSGNEFAKRLHGLLG